MSEQSLSFKERSLTTTHKVVIFTLLSLVLMVLDNRFAAVNQAKRYVATALYPLQWIANQPVKWYEYAHSLIQSQDYLLTENQRLVKENVALKLQAKHAQLLEQDIQHLKALFSLQQNQLQITTAADVISNRKLPNAGRIIINKGNQSGVKNGDAVVDEYGLLGQVNQASAFSAEVMTLNDEHLVIPIAVMRTGVRNLVYGGGDKIELRYFPIDADLKAGDVLMTSGLDSVYPAGIPVAKVVSVQRNAGQPYYQIKLEPVAKLYSSKYVLVLPQSTLPEKELINTASEIAASDTK